jgi:hypothetical protein
MINIAHEFTTIEGYKLQPAKSAIINIQPNKRKQSMMDGLAFLPVPDLTNGIHLLRTLCSDDPPAAAGHCNVGCWHGSLNNKLEEFPVSILTFIWQERIYCSDCYIFEWNPDGVQLFTQW